MITKEMLEGNAGLKGLTPEQIETIVTLSRNDENSVIGARFGEVYRQMDDTIAKSLGIARNGDEKTYLYLERAAKEYANKYQGFDTLKAQVETLKGEKAALEAKMANGEGSSVLKEQLDSVKKELQTTKEQFSTLKNEKDQLEANHAKEMLGLRIDAEMSHAREGLKFRSGMSDAAIGNLVDSAINKVKALNPKYVEENGKQVLRFYDANGVIMNNPDNNLNPFTAKELLMRELNAFDILDKSNRNGTGGGSFIPTPSPSHGYGATQEEAVANIEKELSAKGLVKGTPEYQEEMFRLYDENKVDSLPLQQ